jgi:acetolactate synthase-1/2/3 large subunit
MTSEPMTGARSLIASLETAGTEVVFGIPGGAILPAYDPILDSPIRHILMRHEQGAGHAAEGYAQATGKVGVCMATSGPGATNLVTPLADASMDSVPLVAITGQVPRAVMGNDAFQEADITGITMPVTKHNYKVMDPDEIPLVVAEAFHIASTGRPGPVLIDVPKDVLQARTAFEWPRAFDLPGYRPNLRPDVHQVRSAAELIATAERPVIYVGGGVLKARAVEELQRFAELLGAPVVTTLMARGAFPDDHPQCIGMPGMHGSYAAVTAMQRSDLLISLGARFDDRVTGALDSFAPAAKVIHVDIDPAEIDKNRVADVPIVSDAKTALLELTRAVASEFVRSKSDISQWTSLVGEWDRTNPLFYSQDPGGPVKPQHVIDMIGRATSGEAVCVTGVGQHQMWASQFMPCNNPYGFITSGGLGTMGFAVPAAIGAKVGRPEDRVIAIDGDGCFQMTCQELVTAAVEGIPVTIAILNNGHLGMVKQWQELFYAGRRSQVHLGANLPDFVAVAEAYGGVGLRAESPADVPAVIDKALGITDRFCVIDFRCDEDEMCFPMVPAGHSNDDIIVGPENERPAMVAAAQSYGRPTP